MGIDMDHVSITINDEHDLQIFCKKLAPLITAPLVVGLTGTMGSGKTTFVRSICQELNSTDWVNSPTYSIIQRYSSPIFDICHIDLYRLNGEMDIDLLDIPSLIAHNTIVFIEWIDKTHQFEPDVTIHMTTIDESKRAITLKTLNPDWIQPFK
tara:strand:- start:274 stop:732 length:459 start_codon:yes stop_codon:yes gene_type:complete